MKNPVARWFGATLFALPVLMNMTGSTRAAAQVMCGAVITGDATMTSDLNCPANNPAVQVNGGNLDMHGHRISGCPGVGIEVIGSGSKVSNGSVNGCLQGVHLNSATAAKLTNVVAISNTDFGFLLTAATGNQLIGCAAISNGNDGGFSASTSDDNAFSRCTASNNSGPGFSMSGSGNQVRDSVVVDNGNDAMDFNGSANNLSRNVLTNNAQGLVMNGDGKIADNRVTNSTSRGLAVTGPGAKLSKNVAADNGSIGFDLGGQNQLKNNTASSNGGDGFRVAGTTTTLNSCIANDNGDSGFELISGASANTVNGSVAMGNDTDGVLLVNGAVNNVVTKNVLLESGDNDARDDNTNCDGNQWSKNVLRTKEAGGVPGNSCID